MKIRQALKIRDRVGHRKYSARTVRAAWFKCRRHRERAGNHRGVRTWDWVTIDTDTAYDAEGVPVNVSPGSMGMVTTVDGFPQVLCHTSVGADVVGIPEKYLTRRERPGGRNPRRQ